MKTVMTYRAVDDFLPLAQQHGAAHVERLKTSTDGASC